MLIDPELEDDLNNQYGIQTLNFVKRVFKGIFYVEATVAGGSTITCRVKRGDGSNHEAVTDVIVRTIAAEPIPPAPATEGLITVDTGDAQSGAGTTACWLKTTASGEFSVSISGSLGIVVEMTPNQGVTMMSITGTTSGSGGSMV